MKSNETKRLKYVERQKMCFHIPQELLERFLSYCVKNNISKDGLVETILIEFLKQYSIKGEDKESLFMARKFNLVPYDLSYRLKELGYNNLCGAWYDNTEYNMLKFGKVNNTRMISFNKSSNCIAPSFADVFEWFGAKYKVSIDYSKKGTRYVFFLDGVICEEIYKSEYSMYIGCLTILLDRYVK